ncbi:uncharacterized protein B0I36DRAFT_327683 [Microdochium trichocladiopsis]|uniref:Uncharacterized protein n=1 Tax=Microdochium trichocladiopsis TaxID=1682393 RepID=A0A9P8Y1X7_9PEZI|nr:uncharacterized protein B0I36DRAFT_327683 [Microdochium trichocladiopsis]KAH7027707.1 hypothetical protein B0I36DRAFT_327683 [Microdochium trichocladiopsis]
MGHRSAVRICTTPPLRACVCVCNVPCQCLPSCFSCVGCKCPGACNTTTERTYLSVLQQYVMCRQVTTQLQTGMVQGELALAAGQASPKAAC